MGFHQELSKKEIVSQFGITCPVSITVVCDETPSNKDLEMAIRNYVEFHLASEERVGAADSFWKKFHRNIQDASESEKKSKEYKEWEDAINRLDICKDVFLDMKRSIGLTLHYKEELKAA